MTLPVHLFELAEHPNQIAVSKLDTFVSDGVFFLDFSRPQEHLRSFFGVLNRWVGLSTGLVVPVVHQGEKSGGYVITVHSSDPYFAQLRALWKAHYPTKRIQPTTIADGLKIISDFATQFPDNSQ